jgi:hypothetical protein
MKTLKFSRPARWILGVCVALLLAGAAIHGIMMLMPPPADLDLSRTQASALGSFVATVEPGDLRLGRAMTWTFLVNDADGETVEASDLRVDGGMPLHGHGLPTEPSTPQAIGQGRYEVEGIQFSMAGWWVVKLHRTTPEGDDTATFNFTM